MKNIFIYGIIFIIMGALIGYFLGSDKTSLQNCHSELDRYKKYIDNTFPPVPDEVFSIGGEIKSIDNDMIVLETVPLDEPIFPGEEPKTEERKIRIGSNTKFVRLINLVIPTSEEDKIAEGPQETPIELTDLKAGDFIGVESSENIKSKKEFTATRIIIT